MSKIYYFDYAAATPVDNQVLTAMEPFWQNQFYNPSALYTQARKTRQAVESARSQVASIIGAKPSEIIFTAGATESINLAIGGIKKPSKNANIVISAIEHEAVTAAALKSFGKNLRFCPVSKEGLVQLDVLERLIDDKTILLSIMQVNNEIGTIQPLQQVKQIVDQIRKNRLEKGNLLPLYIHSDASQAPNYLPVNVVRLGVDLLTLNGGKIYGPKQSGCLYVQKNIHLEPLIVGGGQERGLRSGTENVAAIIGFAKALELAQNNWRSESKRLSDLNDYFLAQISQKIPNLVINGSMRNRVASNLNISIPKLSGEMLMHYLDAAGIMVATGAACSASKNLPSETLMAIGLAKEQANCSLRISFGRFTTKEHVQKLVHELPLAIERLLQTEEN